MSRENVETVRRIYAALDVSVPGSVGTVSVPTEPFGKLIDPQIEWNGPREFPDLAEPHYGYEGVKQYLRTIAEVLDDYRMVPERFIDAGEDCVLVFSREGGRGKGSGAEVQTQSLEKETPVTAQPAPSHDFHFHVGRLRRVAPQRARIHRAWSDREATCEDGRAPTASHHYRSDHQRIRSSTGTRK